MPALLLASENRGKLAEIQSLLDDIQVQLVTPNTIDLHLNVTEDGITYAENASKKALAFARSSGMTALGDDSGLEVDALGGRPGLYSARFAPWENATDADRRQYLLEQLSGKPIPWTARFRCVVAIATPEGQVHFAEGVCPGEIISEERGSGGFGYDPVFLIPETGLTMAELSMEDKNRISHRARAIQAAKPILQDIFGL
jgi:XTP/dITP diphosphohydrolase